MSKWNRSEHQISRNEILIIVFCYNLQESHGKFAINCKSENMTLESKGINGSFKVYTEENVWGLIWGLGLSFVVLFLRQCICIPYLRLASNLLCSWGWLQILLPLPSEFWDYMYEPHILIYFCTPVSHPLMTLLSVMFCFFAQSPKATGNLAKESFAAL